MDDPERREIIKSMFVYLKEEYKKRKLPMEALKITARQTGLTHDPMDVFMMEYIEQGIAQGIAQGREQGREEGREEGEVIGEARGETKKALQMAKSMKAKGYPMEEIAELTGLSVEQIKAL